MFLLYTYLHDVFFSYIATSLMGENHSNATVLDLAHQNTLTARELVHKVTVGEVDGGTQTRTAPSPPCIVEPTAGERLAQRVSIHVSVYLSQTVC